MKITAGERIFPRIKTEIRQSSDKKRFTFVISTGTEDRHGTRIHPEGIDLAAFRTNPVVLFNHDYDKIIGRAVGIEVKGGRLIAQMEFDEDDDFARGIKNKVEKGFLNATSIGFMVREVDFGDDDVPDIRQSELMEFSIVSVPSNREALVMSRDTSELRAIKEELASLRKELADSNQHRSGFLQWHDSDTDLMGSHTITLRASTTTDAAEAAEVPESPVEEAILTVETEKDAESTAETSDIEPAEAELSAEPEKAQPQPKRGLSFKEAIALVDDRIDRKLGRK